MSTPLTQIFNGEDGNPSSPDTDDRLLMDDLNLNTKALKSSIFTGNDEIFAFQRAVSRLIEMQGIAWIGTDLASKIEMAQQ